MAPIALYPDPLLAQTLVASTYPLELIQLQQWLAKNTDLKDKALADAVAKQPWDPAIQSMAAVPDVVKRLADDIQWTTQLGDAFLDQQSDVMDAVQRMRKKAEDKGALTSNEQQKVETKVVEQKTVIVVQPTNPEVIYVPSYNPTVVYPPPVYPYPPVYYPPYVPGAALVTFGVGMAMGAAIWGGSCCGCGWGGGNNTSTSTSTTISTGTRTSNINRRRRTRRERQLAAQLPASRRGSLLEQGDGEQVRRVGTRRVAAGSRQASAGGSRGGAAGPRPAPSSRGGARRRRAASRRQAAGASASSAPRRRRRPSASARSGGGASARSGGGSSGGFGGGSGGYSGSSARSSSSRGSSSMSSEAAAEAPGAAAAAEGGGERHEELAWLRNGSASSCSRRPATPRLRTNRNPRRRQRPPSGRSRPRRPPPTR